eukprot:GFYU01037033.1.p1 GENE.GFYU01037033.1~~GFYU01037033.1.p1  ORF type:complete len:102 (+),score=14.78 GFYU01037033.1:27-308(+)
MSTTLTRGVFNLGHYGRSLIHTGGLKSCNVAQALKQSPSTHNRFFMGFFQSRKSATTTANSIHELSATRIDGVEVPLSEYKGKVLLVVNVASK